MPRGHGNKLLLACLVALSGCRSCGGGDAPEGGGPTPFVRCLAAEPAEPPGARLGGLAVRQAGRVLTLEGLPRPTRIAAFAGPSLGPAPSEEALLALKGQAPHLLLVVGGLGDSDAVAAESVRRLASLGVPGLFVAGGTDRPERVAAALAGQTKAVLLDATALDEVVLGRDRIVPVAGAFEGSYALDDAHCGYTLDDLKHRAERLGALPDGQRRWLVAWGTPGGGGPLAVSRGPRGLDLGVADLAELARRTGAAGGLFAWPTAQLGSPRDGAGSRKLLAGEAVADLRLVVPRLVPPPQARGDGSHAMPGFALLELSDRGMALLEVRHIAPK